jgi:flagellar M-ring protein FliF
VKYRVDETSGSVWVQGDAMHDARMKLASQGLPEGTGNGFELMDGQDGFGSSQFVESVRYQRALEGELSRTITSLKSVQHARVHLAIPKQSVFVRKRKKASASVTVGLFPGRMLEPAQVQAIVNLVSSSVPELEAGQITVIDQLGRLLTDEHGSSDMAFSAKQLDYKQQIENSYVKRIENIMTPIVGPGKIKAQVNAELDFTVTEQTQEVFNPDQAAMRSEQTLEERRGGAGATQGVPGALTNQPPEAGTLEDSETTVKNNSATMMNSTRRATRNFEVDKTISHTRLATGTIRRLSVAVLVDNKFSAEGEESKPYTDEEIQRFERLVQDAVGFSVQRGDRINVLNAAFTVVPEPEPLPEESLWKQAWVQELGKQLLGALAVLLLVFTVLRPVMRELAQKGVDMKEYASKLGQGVEGDEDDDTVTLSGKKTARQIQQQTHESQLSTAISMVDQDPRTVAQVLKNWVGTDAG